MPHSHPHRLHPSSIDFENSTLSKLEPSGLRGWSCWISEIFVAVLVVVMHAVIVYLSSIIRVVYNLSATNVSSFLVMAQKHRLTIIVVHTGHNFLDTLALPHLSDNLTRLGLGIERRTTREDLPVVKD